MELPQVVEFLLSNGLHLTALELYQEVKESPNTDGNAFKMPASLEEFVSDESMFSLSPPEESSEGLLVPGDHFPFAVPENCDSEPVFEVLSKRDQRIAQLEYQLRCANEDLSEVQASLAQQQRQAVSPAPLLNRAGSGSQNHQLQRNRNQMGLSPAPPIQSVERGVLNYLVKGYLAETGYPLSAITFADEAGDVADLESLGLVWGERLEKKGSLLALYRNRISSNRDSLELEAELKSLQQKLAETSDQMEKVDMDNNAMKNEIEDLENKLQAALRAPVNVNPETEQPLMSPTSSKDYDSEVSSQGKEFFEGKDTKDLDPATEFQGGCDMTDMKPEILDPEDISGVLQTAIQTLPRVCQSLPDRHRLSILPLLLAVLKKNVEEKAYEAVILDLVLELIPNPSLPQRRQVIQGLVEVYRDVGEDLLLQDVYPHLVDLVANSYDELRILAMEAAVQLLEMVKGSTDLLENTISILEQGAEDTEVAVRKATMECFASVLGLFASKELLARCIKVTFHLVQKEYAESVLQTVGSQVMRTIVDTSSSLGCLYTESLPQMLASIHQELVRKDQDAADGWIGAGSSSLGLTESLLTQLAVLIELTIERMIAEGPTLQESKALMFSLSDNSQGKNQLLTGMEAFRALLRGRGCLKEVAGDFSDDEEDESESDDAEFDTSYRVSSPSRRPARAQWAGLQWITNQLLPSLLQIISKAPESAVDALGAPIQAVCLGCGMEFAGLIVLPQLMLAEGMGLSVYTDILRLILHPETADRDFTPLIQIVRCQEGFTEVPSSVSRPFDVFRALFFPSFDEAQSEIVAPFPGGIHKGENRKWKALRVLLEGAFPALTPKVARKALSAIVEELAVLKGNEQEEGLQQFIVGFSRLYIVLGKEEPTGVKKPKLHQDGEELRRSLLAVFWDLSHDQSTSSTLIATRMFGVLVGLMDPVQVGKRILPALLNLSGEDQEIEIRLEAIKSLGMMYKTALDDSILDQVNAEIQGLMSEGNPFVEIEILQVLQSCIPTCPASQRDGFILDQIVEASQKVCRCQNQFSERHHMKRVAEILRKTYHCYNSCMIPEEHQARLVPGIEALLNASKLLKLGSKSELQSLLSNITVQSSPSRSRMTSANSRISGLTAFHDMVDEVQSEASYPSRSDPDIPPSKHKGGIALIKDFFGDIDRNIKKATEDSRR